MQVEAGKRSSALATTSAQSGSSTLEPVVLRAAKIALALVNTALN